MQCKRSSELAEQHGAPRAWLYAHGHGPGTVRVSDNRISTDEHATGRNKQHREHAEWLLTIPSHHRTASGSKLSQRKVLPSTGKKQPIRVA